MKQNPCKRKSVKVKKGLCQWSMCVYGCLPSITLSSSYAHARKCDIIKVSSYMNTKTNIFIYIGEEKSNNDFETDRECGGTYTT